MTSSFCDLGMVGLGVMGRSLVLNLADRGFSVAGYDKNLAQGQTLLGEAVGKPVQAADSPATFVRMLRPPRVILILVAPAPVVDFVLRDLQPLLEPGDLVIDAGNSYFKDTYRRAKTLAETGVRFFGMGVSGGEAGARHGPSLMPGGPRDAYERVRPMLEAVAAKVDGEPCVTYLGPGSCGHYVKMVHNGIEYAVMQLLAEAYDLLRRGPGLNNDELADLFGRWNQGRLNSFLVEITAQVFRKVDPTTGGRLIDVVKDVARQKGTGKWTSQDALDLVVPVPSIDAAVTARELSDYVAERAALHTAYPAPPAPFTGAREAVVAGLERALHAAILIAYAQGLDLLRKASAAYGFGLHLGEVARIWRGGCIIRAALLTDVRAAYQARPDLATLLLAPRIAEALRPEVPELRAMVKLAVDLGVPAPGLMAGLAYVDGLRSGRLPTNLIQAQRDFFGAHTYERTDREGTFHTSWDA